MMTLYFTAKIIAWIIQAMLITAGAMLYAVLLLVTWLVTGLEWAIRTVADNRENR